MKDLQKTCNHEWEESAVKNYSHCIFCGLMRDDKNGDLFDPENLDEAARITRLSILKRFVFWLRRRSIHDIL